MTAAKRPTAVEQAIAAAEAANAREPRPAIFDDPAVCALASRVLFGSDRSTATSSDEAVAS